MIIQRNARVGLCRANAWLESKRRKRCCLDMGCLGCGHQSRYEMVCEIVRRIGVGVSGETRRRWAGK